MNDVVGVIGAGRMGLPIIGHLARKGFRTLAADVDPRKKTQVESRQAVWSSIEDLARERFTFENDPPDRNYFNLGAGIVLVLPHGISPFVNYRSLVGYKDQSSHTVTAGLRVEF